jgi:hypothetical protein
MHEMPCSSFQLKCMPIIVNMKLLAAGASQYLRTIPEMFSYVCG